MSGISINHSSKCVRVWHDDQQTYFCFKEHGNQQCALLKALEFEQSLSDESKLAKHKPHKHGSGASGVAGVGKYVTKGEQYGWVAYVSVGPVGNRYQVSQCFGFATYGNRAFDMAVRWRESMVGQTLPTSGGDPILLCTMS